MGPSERLDSVWTMIHRGNEMTEVNMELIELLSTVRTVGFDVVDADSLPVNEEMLDSLEDNELASAEVRLVFRSPPAKDTERTIVADIHAADQIFHLVGDPRETNVLRTHLRGATRQRTAPWEE